MLHKIHLLSAIVLVVIVLGFAGFSTPVLAQPLAAPVLAQSSTSLVSAQPVLAAGGSFRSVWGYVTIHYIHVSKYGTNEVNTLRVSAATNNYRPINMIVTINNGQYSRPQSFSSPWYYGWNLYFPPTSTHFTISIELPINQDYRNRSNDRYTECGSAWLSSSSSNTQIDCNVTVFV